MVHFNVIVSSLLAFVLAEYHVPGRSCGNYNEVGGFSSSECVGPGSADSESIGYPTLRIAKLAEG